MLALTETPAHHFLRRFLDDVPRPNAILVASAHWETDAPRLGAAPKPQTVHDFFGFPEPLYRLTYPAPGAPDLAQRAAQLLQAAGFKSAGTDATYGLDHGAWMPLLLGHPAADIPVLQLSLQTALGPRHHYALGQALRALREEGVLILGSGSLTHNLRRLVFGDPQAAPRDFAVQFADWVEAALQARRDEAMLNYRAEAPEAVANHPSDEHFLPLFVALGAATPGRAAVTLHRSMEYGSLAMDAYRFD